MMMLFDLSWPNQIPYFVSLVIETFIYIALLSMILSIIFNKNILSNIIVLSAFSTILSINYAILQAPDVALTEAAIGSAITSSMLLITFSLIDQDKHDNTKYNIYHILSFCMCSIFGAILIYYNLFLPEYGSSLSEIHKNVANYYIENTAKDIGIKSVVTAILSSYRAYDTLGEIIVIFTAGISINLTLGFCNDKIYKEKKEDIIFSIFAPFLGSLIFIFAIYIQINGDSSPGGGFQAGAILSSMIILYSTLSSQNKIKNYLTPQRLEILSAIGVLIYILTGMIPMFRGKEFLCHDAILYNMKNESQLLGIFLVEFGIGLTVFSVITLIFLTLIQRKQNV